MLIIIGLLKLSGMNVLFIMVLNFYYVIFYFDKVIFIYLEFVELIYCSY